VRQEFDKYLGIVGLSVVLWYLFKDASGTTAILNSLSKFNTNAIGALQGRNVAGY
jgi:hypothetical protein